MPQFAHEGGRGALRWFMRFDLSRVHHPSLWFSWTDRYDVAFAVSWGDSATDPVLLLDLSWHLPRWARWLTDRWYPPDPSQPLDP